MKNHLDLFTDYLKNTKKCSDNTMDSYMRDINQFVAYCTEYNIKDTARVDSDFIHKYLDSVTSAGKSEATKTRIIASLRCSGRLAGILSWHTRTCPHRRFSACTPCSGIR
mgnify:CR=1 FL=1